MKLHQTLFFILLFFIYGCGDESTEKNNGIDHSVNLIDIESHDMQKKALKNDVVLINVGATTDSSAELKISKHVLLNQNPDCVINDIDGLNMSISSNGIGECRYEYTVTPENESLYDGESKSIVRVSVSETAQESTLTAINKETNLDTDVVIDIEAELNSELSDSDYQVVDDVTVVGSGFAHVDTIENTITYTPETIGVSEIMYSITDGVNTLLGSIYVSVSDTENTPPVANNYVKDGVILKGTMIEVDLSDVISDEEDEVLLDTVNAYNANVSITSSTDHTFTFESEIPGGHEVTYTISDSRGGYAVAQVYIEVEADFSLIQDWEDITVYDPYIDSDITFTAPMSKVMAEYVNSSYTETFIEDGITGPKAEIALMTLNQAKKYCASRNGRLPISREWNELLQTNGNLYTKDNWPAGYSYWSADKSSETDAVNFNALNGTASSLPEDDLGYTSCILFTDNVEDFSFENVDIEPGVSVTSEIHTTFLDPDKNPAPFQNVRILTENQKGGFSVDLNSVVSDSLSLKTDGYGGLNAIYYDTSLNNEVIIVDNVYTANKSEVYTSNVFENIEINVTDESAWNRDVVDDNINGIPTILLPIDDNGLSIYDYNAVMEGNISHTSNSNIYKSTFSGDDFMFYIEYESEVEVTQGRYMFVIQQEAERYQSDWSQSPWFPAVPLTDKIFALRQDFTSQEINIYYGLEVQSSELTIENKLVNSTKLYQWVIKVGDTLTYYVSLTPERPKEPLFSIPFDWAGIDPTLPYWVGIPARHDTNWNVVTRGVMSGVGFESW